MRLELVQVPYRKTVWTSQPWPHQYKITPITTNRWTKLHVWLTGRELKAGLWFWSNCSLTEVLPASGRIKNLSPDPLNPFNKSKSFNLTSWLPGFWIELVMSSLPHLSGWKRRVTLFLLEAKITSKTFKVQTIWSVNIRSTGEVSESAKKWLV